MSSPASLSPELTDMDSLVASLKRRAVTLEKERDEALGKKKQKQNSGTSTRARGILKVASMHSLNEILAEVDRREVAQLEAEDGSDNEEENLSTLTPKELEEQQNVKRSRDRLYNAYLAISGLLLGFRKTLSTASDDEQERYIRSLERSAILARGDDISRAKIKVANIINRLLPTPVPLLDPGDRTNRGFQHNDTGRRLCPIEYNWDDLNVRAKIRVQDPSYPTNGSMFFSGLYHRLQGDPVDVESGFLKNGELIKLAKCLITSSNSAEGYDIEGQNQPPPTKIGKAPTKKNVAQILGITAVTPPLIAYITCMYHFSLTDASSWDPNYNGFSYISLCDTIVDYFEDVQSGTDEEKHTKELLAWWTKHLFPEHQSVAASASSVVAFKSKVRAQREAKAKAAAEAAIAAGN